MFANSRTLVALATGGLLLLVGVVSPVAFTPERERLLTELQSAANVTVHQYSVVGKTPEAVRKDLDERGPKDEYGNPRDAYTKWGISWRWPRNGDLPDFENTAVAYEVEITLPRWEGVMRASPEAQSSWNEYLTALLRHEKQHLSFVQDNYKEVARSVRDAYRKNPQLTSEEANKIASKVVASIRSLDREYDQRTRNGREEGVRFPG